MLKLDSREDLDRYQRDRVILSVYLDHAYTRERVSAVMGMKDGFDAHVREAWHMLIPYDKGYSVDVPLDPDRYGVHLARQIIEEQGLKHEELPALVFELPQQEYYAVRLSGRTIDEMQALIGGIGDIVVEEFKNGPRDVTAFRERVHHRVVPFVNKSRALHFIAGKAPHVLALLGAGAGFVA